MPTIALADLAYVADEDAGAGEPRISRVSCGRYDDDKNREKLRWEKVAARRAEAQFPRTYLSFALSPRATCCCLTFLNHDNLRRFCAPSVQRADEATRDLFAGQTSFR